MYSSFFKIEGENFFLIFIFYFLNKRKRQTTSLTPHQDQLVYLLTNGYTVVISDSFVGSIITINGVGFKQLNINKDAIYFTTLPNTISPLDINISSPLTISIVNDNQIILNTSTYYRTTPNDIKVNGNYIPVSTVLTTDGVIPNKYALTIST